MADKLGIGSVFPTMTVATTDGRTVTLPTDLASTFKVILFYRGHW
jgi:peroxiredoxin